jgi:cytochrome c5
MSENKEHVGEKLWGIVAEYDSPGALKKAAAKVRDAGYEKWDCYSPFPVHGLDPAMGIKMTILPMIVFAAGCTGAVLAMLLQWWTNAYDWPWIISGKPFFSIPASIPIGFEFTVLLSAFAAFFGMWGLNKLPQVWHPLFKKHQFTSVTTDGFFLAIEADDDNFDEYDTFTLLEESGATDVEECYSSTDPDRRRMPKAIVAFIVVSTAFTLVPFACVAKARSAKSRLPHYNVYPDMDYQFFDKEQSASPFFADGVTARTWVAGTVPRGDLKADNALFRGTVGADWVQGFPARFQPNTRAMEAGRKNYNIFCAPCHGETGQGDGMVSKRAVDIGTLWIPPTNLHAGYVVTQPNGQLFNSIKHGVRNMPAYGHLMHEGEIWATILYMRALQRSYAASPGDENYTPPPQPTPEQRPSPHGGGAPGGPSGPSPHGGGAPGGAAPGGPPAPGGKMPSGHPPTPAPAQP